ncbi:hypothetical protein [uncultured Vagococcus sp.]|uniref:hypothetical protein n=1 Tax=uncultured Vagococcus sp. TaxID=189676 RepID=UPI0028D337C9|nr:hypothetical protein [uncultured Vagococcus sp.]
MDKLTDKQQEVVETSQEKARDSQEDYQPEIETLVEDTDLLTSDSDEDEEEQGRSYLLMALCGAVVVLLVGIGLLFYRYYPLNSKIAGTWTGEAVGAQYKVENTKDSSTFTMLNTNGTNGMDMVFQSKLTKEAANEYFVKDTKVFLKLSYEALGEETIQSFAANKEMFKVVLDDKKTMLLAYTKDGLAYSFGDKDLNTLFKYVLRDFKWSKMGGDTLNLRNDLFASGGISFKREK